MKVVGMGWDDKMMDTVVISYEDGKKLYVRANRSTGRVDVQLALGSLLIRPVANNSVVLEVEE